MKKLRYSILIVAIFLLPISSLLKTNTPNEQLVRGGAKRDSLNEPSEWDHFLPGDLQPQKYDLKIITDVRFFNQMYAGIVLITVKCLRSTDKIILHEKDLQIFEDQVEIKLSGADTPSFIPIKKHEYNTDHDKYIIILRETLEKDKNYEIKIEYARSSMIKSDDGYLLQEYRQSITEDPLIHFYTKLVPFLNSLRNIKHLIPPFLDYKREIQPADTIAVMFRHLGPQWVCNNYKSLLDYPHLSLMMRKIGEFHAYSFAAKGRNESKFQKLSSFRKNNFNVVIEHFEARMKQTLERCLQSLRNDQRYAKAIPCLENLIQNYVDFVKKTYESSPEDQCYVLGHLSFNQSNVLFTYDDHIPVDMKIMDWQTASFVSLGIDLVSTLYTDASQQTRDEYWDRLLDDYHDSLKTTFPDNIVPSKNQVLVELKKSISAAIFVVTYRANNFHLKTESKDKSQALWNDEFVTEMLKDMINRGFL